MNDPDQPTPTAQDVPILHRPSEALNDVVAGHDALDLCLAALSAGVGPFAIDVERAGGYRYTQRAYLLQIRREGAGTWLIDPLGLADFSDLADLLEQDEWVLHAANQDLPSLQDLGLRCPSLFDTELAGRLLGLPRVGLAAMTEHYLGYSLAKAHSAADWSARPLPRDWLNYAALDVEPLIQLREHLHRDLTTAGRHEWAQQEFEWVRRCPPAPPRAEPWRRVKGLSNRSPRALAIARELWQVRDETARTRDKAPSRVLPDAAIANLADDPPTSAGELRARPAFRRQSDAQLRAWFAAVQRAQRMPEAELPSRRATGDVVPNPRSWERINPLAAQRLEAARTDLGLMAESLGVARENLIAPGLLRDVIWNVSGRHDSHRRTTPDAEEVAEMLSGVGARPWQVSLVASAVAQAIATADARVAENAAASSDAETD